MHKSDADAPPNTSIVKPTAIMVSPSGKFRDYDDEIVYRDSQSLALDPSVLNFIVDFGKDSAHIAFDSSPEDVKKLLIDTPRNTVERPIRWMYVFFVLDE